MLLLWTENLRVGIEEFDEDHKTLIALVNRLHGAVQNGTSGEILGGVLGALEHHAWDHCRREELLLMRALYPGALEHVEEHNELRRMIGLMKQRHAAGPDASLPVDVMNLIYVWITNHVYGADRKVSEYLRAAGLTHLLSDPAPSSAGRSMPAQYLAADDPAESREAMALRESVAPIDGRARGRGSLTTRSAGSLEPARSGKAPKP